MAAIKFPEGFVWGTATAAFQIEGAVHADGRSESVWDRFCHTPGKVANGDNADEACRHYEKWREDLQLIKDLGVSSYRFSIAWPRVIPGGRGHINEKGLDFYERLVDEMLRLGIQPNATLYHWDLPQVLEDKNGWLNRDTAYAYADYAQAVLRRLKDKPVFWATFNEPQIFIGHGYENGEHAPGRRESKKDVTQAIHHVLLAHGLGMQVIREHAPKSQAGIAFAPAGVWPASQSKEDLEASLAHWECSNDWWTLPILEGRYPERPMAWLGADAPLVKDGDMKIIGSGVDFLGLNYYLPARTMADPSSPRGFKGAPQPDNCPRPDFPGWEIFAPGLENLLVQFSRRYGNIPLYVTENGMSVASEDLADPRRIAFLEGHIAACHAAIARGANLKGYYVWSLMDNFEWALGYKPRFGLVNVDYKTFERRPKDSYRWYKAVAAGNGFEMRDQELAPEFNFFPATQGAKR